MEITGVTITLANEGQLRAFATVTLDDSFVIRDLRIIEGPDGLFLAGPQLDREKDARFDDAQPSRPNLRRIFEQRILAEYRKISVMMGMTWRDAPSGGETLPGGRPSRTCKHDNA